MSKLSPEAQQLASRAGLLIAAEERLSNPLTVKRLIQIMMAEHQAFAGDKPENVAATHETLTSKVFRLDGTELPEVVKELRDEVASMLGLGRQSPVQRTLNGNGYRLCPTRVRMRFTDSSGGVGVDYTRVFAARFITNVGQLIYETLFESQVDSLKKSVDRKGDLFRLIAEGHPELLDPMRNRLNQLDTDMDKGLALPEPEPNGTEPTPTEPTVSDDTEPEDSTTTDDDDN